MISQQAVQRYDVGRAERWLGARDVGDLDPRAAVGQCDLIRRVELCFIRATALDLL